MTVESCIPIIPSADPERSLRLWVDGLGFKMESEMHSDGKLIFCMLRRGGLTFMLNRRAGTPTKPEHYEGIRLYWAPSDIRETRERLIRMGYKVSELEERHYGQTEFFLTDDDGFSHCFGVATRT
jgi:catechol 2,3-dioxygenase-like lactoylglutathione lyase family enzyme